MAINGYDAPLNKRLKTASKYTISFWRQQLFNTLQNTPSDSPQRALIEALTLGFRDNMTPQQWQVRINTGPATC